jgi:translation initiation factor IF-2
VSEVAQGYECGLSIEGYGDVREKDVIEAFEIETVAPTLENPTGDSKRS